MNEELLCIHQAKSNKMYIFTNGTYYSDGFDHVTHRSQWKIVDNKFHYKHSGADEFCIVESGDELQEEKQIIQCIESALERKYIFGEHSE